jgi:hypothetical protein
MSSIRFALTSTLVATALLSLTSCKEEDNRLFEEGGVWALQAFTLDGTAIMDLDAQRRNHFLLRFSPDDGVVATAACKVSPSETVTDSSCGFNSIDAEWECHCFAYEFDNSIMRWQEFAPGENPPPVGAPAGDGETDGMTAGSHEIELEEAKASGTYQYFPLPEGIFGSDGVTSKHVFQSRAESVWTGADINEDDAPDLDGCTQACFPSLRG